jgi:hypothetical protein
MKRVIVCVVVLFIAVAATVFAGKITEYIVATSPSGDDVLVGTDVSDTSMAPSGTTKGFRLRDLPVSDPAAAALAGKQDVVTSAGANTVMAGPTSGAPGVASMRGLVDNDVPDTITAINYVPKALPCLSAAPGSPGNGQPECADGNNWQIDASQGTDDWLVYYRAADSTWVGVYNLTDGIQIVSQIDESVPIADGDGTGSLLFDFSFSAPRTISIRGDRNMTLPENQTRCQTWAAMTSSSDHMLTSFPHAITIRRVRVVQRGATNIVGHLDECDSAGASCAGVDGATDITASSSQATDDGTLSNASIDANDVIQWHTTSVSGTNTDAMVCVDFTVD